MWNIFLCLSGGNPYDIYNKTMGYGKYAGIAGKTKGMEQEIYHIILNVGVYLSAICFMVAGAMLVINSRGKSERLSEAKGFLTKTLIISALVFGVTNLVNIVITMGLD